jgi:hypothetical protein
MAAVSLQELTAVIEAYGVAEDWEGRGRELAEILYYRYDIQTKDNDR